MKRLFTALFFLAPMLVFGQIKYNWATTNQSPVPTVGQGGTGQTTASAALTALGGIGPTVSNLYLKGITNLDGGFIWTNNGGLAQLQSPDDGNFSLQQALTHGTTHGNNTETELTVNQLAIAPIDGNHIQLGLSGGQPLGMGITAWFNGSTTGYSFSNPFGWLTKYASGNLLWQGWSDTYNVATNAAGATQWHLSKPIVGGQADFYQKGPDAIRVDDSGSFEFTGMLRAGYSVVTPNGTNCPVNFTNTQYQEFNLNQAAFFYITNLNFAGMLTNTVCLQPRLFIYSGPGGAEALTFPSTWIWISENGLQIAPTNIPAATFMSVALEVTVGTTNSFIANYKLGSYTPVYDINAQNFFTIASISSATEKAAINNLVINMKAQSLWTGAFDFVYPMCGGTSNTMAWNLVNTNVAKITWNNSGLATFTANGAGGDGNIAFGSTGWNPSTQTNVLYTLNSACLGVYSKFNPGFSGSGQAQIGAVTGGGSATFWTSAGTATVATSVTLKGANENSSSAIPTYGPGVQMFNRTASTTCSIYSGANSSGDGTTTASVPNSTFYVMAEDNGGVDRPSTNSICIAFGGRGLNSTELANWQADLAAFAAARGIQ